MEGRIPQELLAGAVAQRTFRSATPTSRWKRSFPTPAGREAGAKEVRFANNPEAAGLRTAPELAGLRRKDGSPSG